MTTDVEPAHPAATERQEMVARWAARPGVDAARATPRRCARRATRLPRTDATVCDEA